jgi:osmotically-inducible protein OsmY
MGTFTLNLPDSFTVTMRNGASVTVETATLMEAVGPELMAYGVGQKIRDSASGAAKAAEADGSEGVMAEAQTMMEACLAGLLAGEWSARGDGGSVDPRVAVARSITRAAIKAKLGKDSPKWAAFTGLSDAEQVAKLDEQYAANESALTDAVDAELERRAKAKAAKAKIVKAVSFNL